MLKVSLLINQRLKAVVFMDSVIVGSVAYISDYAKIVLAHTFKA